MALEKIDNLLTSAAVKAEVLGRRYSWRLAGLFRSWATTVQEVFLIICQYLRWTSVDPELVKAAQGASPRERLRHPSGSLASNMVSRLAGELMQGVYVLDKSTTMKLSEISWRNDPCRDTSASSWLFFHSLEWIVGLMDAYRLTGHPGFLDRAKELTGRWICDCLYAERGHIWDDHGTAIRAIVLCQLWNACQPSEPQGSPFMCDLLSAIIRHANKLANESFYRPEHNHGVTQAYALMAIGLLFPAHSKAPRWAELGRSRLEAQMAENVSPEGVHCEHSPYYQFYVFRHFFYAYQIAQAYGLNFSQNFIDRLQGMLASGAHFLKPNGTLPALGDTSKNSPILVEKHERLEWPVQAAKEFLYSRTQGTEGSPPKVANVLFPRAGYAFFRSGWGTKEPFQEERSLAFRVSTFNTSHIHRDLFTFELYAYGEDLIVDSGGPFAYENPIREFFLSTGAHNTVVVDGGNQEVGEAKILQWKTSAEYDLLDAEHRTYSNVVHRRAVLFIRPWYFIIMDLLKSDRSHHYSQLFHLNPCQQVVRKELCISTVNQSGGPTVQVLPLLEEGLGLSQWHGNLNPRQGWICLGDQQMIPNTVVDYQRSGTTASFAVLIVPEPRGASTRVGGHIEGIPFSAKTHFQVNIGDLYDEIIFSPEGEVTIKRTCHDRRS